MQFKIRGYCIFKIPKNIIDRKFSNLTKYIIHVVQKLHKIYNSEIKINFIKNK